MKHRDRQLIIKIIDECKDIIRYTGEIGKDALS